MIAVAACGAAQTGTGTAAGTGTGTSTGVSTPPPPDAAVSQDEVLAAIQKAMNELTPAVQGCWAAAATEHFDIAGELAAQIDVKPGATHAAIVRDSAHDDALAACVVALLEKYPYAPPLRGQSFQLPFEFKAPDGQSVIDRRMVSWRGQDKLSIAVLLDANNSGNPAASLLEVAIAANGATPTRIADRAEVWYFLGPARARWGTKDERVAAGDMLYVPKGGARSIEALDQDVHAVLALVPGGREGAARAGALPMREASMGTSSIEPVLLRGSTATTYGPATIYLDDSVAKATPLAASILQLPGGAKVPEHVHDKETEILYVLAGSGTMTIAGKDIQVTSTSVIQIPPNTKHAFSAAEPVRAVQFYTPAGPEQRFKKK
jgi:quercetin dioxygenase-like cupin family protein